MLKIIAGTALAAFAAFASPAAAQDWPNRPVTLVVPYAAGGPVDTIARIMAARLSEILGQQMVIENVGGAGGLTGTVRVAKAAPDGYTLLLSGSAVLSQNPTFRKQSPYDPIADFAHVGAVLGFGARPDRPQGFPARRLQDVPDLHQGEPDHAAIRLAGRGLGRAHLRDPARRRDGRQDHPCAVPRRRPRHAGPAWRPHRLHDGADFDRHAADQSRRRESLCDARPRTRARAREHPDRARSLA